MVCASDPSCGVNVTGIPPCEVKTELYCAKLRRSDTLLADMHRKTEPEQQHQDNHDQRNDHLPVAWLWRGTGVRRQNVAEQNVEHQGDDAQKNQRYEIGRAAS